MLVNENDLVAAVKKFVEGYLERGLGGYSGRELELHVLDMILKINPSLREATIFEKSRILKATETKIKNMLYEIKLRSEEDCEEFSNRIEKNLSSAVFDKGRLILEIDDLYSQKKIKAILKKGGYITDSSFNSDLMKIPYEGLVDIVQEVFPKKIKSTAFKDMVATKKMVAKNREIVKSFSIPGSKLSVGNVWDLATSSTTSIKSFIELKIAENKKSKRKKTK